MATEYINPQWRLPNEKTGNNQGYSLDFDGSQVVEVPLSINGFSSVTMSVWFKTSTPQSNKYLLSFPRTVTNNGFDINFTNGITSYLAGSSGAFNTLSSAFPAYNDETGIT